MTPWIDASHNGSAFCAKRRRSEGSRHVPLGPELAVIPVAAAVAAALEAAILQQASSQHPHHLPHHRPRKAASVPSPKPQAVAPLSISVAPCPASELLRCHGIQTSSLQQLSAALPGPSYRPGPGEAQKHQLAGGLAWQHGLTAGCPSTPRRQHHPLSQASEQRRECSVAAAPLKRPRSALSPSQGLVPDIALLAESCSPPCAAALAALLEPAGTASRAGYVHELPHEPHHTDSRSAQVVLPRGSPLKAHPGYGGAAAPQQLYVRTLPGSKSDRGGHTGGLPPSPSSAAAAAAGSHKHAPSNIRQTRTPQSVPYHSPAPWDPTPAPQPAGSGRGAWPRPASTPVPSAAAADTVGTARSAPGAGAAARTVSSGWVAPLASSCSQVSHPSWRTTVSAGFGAPVTTTALTTPGAAPPRPVATVTTGGSPPRAASQRRSTSLKTNNCDAAVPAPQAATPSGASSAPRAARASRSSSSLEAGAELMRQALMRLMPPAPQLPAYATTQMKVEAAQEPALGAAQDCDRHVLSSKGPVVVACRPASECVSSSRVMGRGEQPGEPCLQVRPPAPEPPCQQLGQRLQMQRDLMPAQDAGVGAAEGPDVLAVEHRALPQQQAPEQEGCRSSPSVVSSSGSWPATALALPALEGLLEAAAAAVSTAAALSAHSAGGSPHCAAEAKVAGSSGLERQRAPGFSAEEVPRVEPERFFEPDGRLLSGAVLQTACNIIRLVKTRNNLTIALPWCEAAHEDSGPSGGARRAASGVPAWAAAAERPGGVPLVSALQFLAAYAGAARALQLAQARLVEELAAAGSVEEAAAELEAYRALWPLMRRGLKCAEKLMAKVERALTGEAAADASPCGSPL